MKHLISLASLSDMPKLFTKNKKTLQSVTIMGGAFYDTGNFTEYSECNIAYDPEASDNFFSICDGVLVEVVPLDVTRKVSWDEQIIDTIPENISWHRWIKHILKAWYKNYGIKKGRTLKLHDPVAMYLSFFPQKAVWKSSGVEVIISGEKRGQTIFHASRPQCNVALELKNPSEIAQNIFDIIFSI